MLICGRVVAQLVETFGFETVCQRGKYIGHRREPTILPSLLAGHIWILKRLEFVESNLISS